MTENWASREVSCVQIERSAAQPLPRASPAAPVSHQVQVTSASTRVSTMQGGETAGGGCAWVGLSYVRCSEGRETPGHHLAGSPSPLLWP